MSDVLDRIRRELQQRLESTRAAAQEHERVRAALEALEHAARPFEDATRRAAGEASRRGRGLVARARPGAQDDSAATKTRKPASARGPKPSSGPATSKRQAQRRVSANSARARAPRGANREAVLSVVRERPGVTTSELATTSGVTGSTLYSLLRRLTEQGVIVKRELPGGQTGYAPATGDAAAPRGAVRADEPQAERPPATSQEGEG
jgi:ribosomal protein S25